MFRGQKSKMEKINKMWIRCLNYINNDLVIPINEYIIIIDNACDQIIVNINNFLIESLTDIQFNLGGGFK